MQPPSPKWFNLETSRPTSNYVTVGNPSYHPNTGSYLPKNQPKNQDNMFKSNLLTRYSSQQDLQSYARHKVVGEELDNSPKSQQNFIYKKTNYFPTRKSNNLDGKGVSAFIPSQVKRKSSIITGEPNVQYFKSPVFENKGIKYLKQTSSTSSTENIITGSRSEKAIPTFLKRTSQHKRTFQESALFKTRDMFASYHSKQPQVSIDSFEIIGKLGEGKFASVFMAMQKLTGFIVALKVVEKKRIIQENFLTQFIRQIKIQAYLDHPNIARIYGFFHDQNYFYSILQMGQGGQLYDIIKNGQTLSQESTSFIVGNLLDAISYIHEKKILHRDIKPENIVLVHGNVKLCDFGWAVYKKAELRSTFCGTPLYLPPELLNGDKYDEKVDLWALGVMAFELHLGSSPFNIESQQDLLKIITNEIEYPQDCHVSKNFKEFIGAVLQKDPKARPQAKKLKELKFIKRYKELETCEELCQ